MVIVVQLQMSSIKGTNALPDIALTLMDIARYVLQVAFKSCNFQRVLHVPQQRFPLYSSQRRACQIEMVTNM